MRTENTFRHYGKAAFAFVFTTATYLLARTTGFLPSWLGNEPENAVTSPEDASQIAGQRRLLQTGSGVTVVNPIPDQVIEATDLYQYDISNVFSGNYALLTMGLANGSVMQPWLNVQYLSLSSYDTPDWAYGVQVQNGTAYMADGGSGLQILNISNPRNITRSGSYGALGYAVDVQVQNGVAYIASGASGLQVLNISNPRNITRLGGYNLPGEAWAVQVQNNVAYVADDTSGLQVLNVSNPLNITRLGGYATPGYSRDLQIQDGIAYVADGTSGLQVLNISNPSNVTFISSYYHGGPNDARRVYVQNGLAYLSDYDGLQILNISNPTNITRLGSYNTPGEIYGVKVREGLAYVADYNAGLQVLNVSNPSTINYLGGYDTPDKAWDVDLHDRLIYVADQYSGLQVIDQSQGQLLGTPTAARVGESYLIRVSAYIETELVAYEDFRLTVARLPRRVDTSLIDRSVLPYQTLLIDLDSDVLFTDPDASTLTLSTEISALTAATQLPRSLLQLNPIFLGGYDTPGLAYGVLVQNGLVYVADGTSGLQILDVRNPASIIRLGSYNTPDLAYGVEVLNGLAYVADWSSGLQILNVSDPSNIVYMGSYNTPGAAQRVQVRNGIAYIADSLSGLQILNVSNPNNITYLGSYDTLGLATDLQVLNGLAYVADGGPGLQVLNVTNPKNITWIGSYDTPSVYYAMNVKVLNSLAFVADSSAGLQVLNISSPNNINRLGNYSALSVGQNIQILNGLAYVADRLSGIQILNINNFKNITRLGGYDTQGSAYDVQVQNGLAYVADDSAGLQVLDLTQWQWSVTPTFAELGNYRVTITATNELGGTASDSFELRVEGGPQLNPNMTIPPLFAKVGVPFNYFIPQGLLSDPNNDPISFSARSADNSSLPSWLSFNGISATFSGLAQGSNVGNYSLRIIATDNVPGTLNAETVFSLSVDNLPYVNQRVSDQVAGVSLFYNFTVPSNTFIDPDNGDILSYSTRQRDGRALPLWLNFNASLRCFFGTPSISDMGSVSLVLLANDGHAGEAQSEFNLLVEHFPFVNLNQSWMIPVAGVGQTWAMTLPSNSFLDEDDTQLSYSLMRADGTNPPSWLSFNPFSGALLGIPLATDLGVNPLRVIATDPHGGSGYREFNLTVVYFPSVANAIPKPPAARVLRSFNFSIPPQTFSDLDSPVLIYNATLSTSQPLPAWLSFDAQALRLLGTPALTDEGTLNLLITAQDPQGASIGAPMDVVVQPNFPPQLVTQISTQTATVLQPFDFVVPIATFQDINGDPLTYRAQLAEGGHLPSWLAFDAPQLRFHGTPGRSDTGDLGSRALDIQLTAADDLSQTQTTFRITVQGDSHLLLFLKIGVPLLTSISVGLGLYKKRALLFNRYKKERYQKLSQTTIIGEHYDYKLETPREFVAKVQAKLLGHAPEGYGAAFVGLFKSPHQRLPASRSLPTWLEYDPDDHTLRSKGPVPDTVRHRELIIQVKDKDDITREEFVLTVLPAAQNTTGEDEKAGHQSQGKVEIIEKANEAAVTGPTPTTGVSNPQPRWLAPPRQEYSSSHSSPPLPDITDALELTTLSQPAIQTTFRS